MIRFSVSFFVAFSLVFLSAAHADEQWYRGDHDGAIAAYRVLLEADPDNEDARVNLTLLLREAGRLEEAVEVSALLTGSARVHHASTVILASGRADEDLLGSSSGEAGAEDGVLLFWSGLAAYRSGRYDLAEERFARALQATPELAYARYFRGRLALGRGDWDRAIEHLEGARRLEPNLTSAFAPLARAYYERGDSAAGIALLDRAAIALPWDTEIPALAALWRDEHPVAAAREAAAAQHRRAVAQAPVVAEITGSRQTMPWVRVGLAENVRSIFLKTGGPFRIVPVPDDLVYRSSAQREAARGEMPDSGERLPGGQVLRVSLDGESGTLTVSNEEGEVLSSAAQPLRLVYDDPRHTTILFDVTYGHGQFSAGREDRSYRGEIEFLPFFQSGTGTGTFTVVNDLPIEEYLYSVVPSEMPAWWPQAALEAQAVAARSYTMHRRDRFRPRGFDLVSSVLSAFYRGVSGEHPRTTQAVEATRGQVLMDGSRPLDAVYSANSGGITESARSVWGGASVLVGVVDPLLPEITGLRSPLETYSWIQSRPASYSGASPWAFPAAYRWSLLVAVEDIRRRLLSSGVDVGTVLEVRPGTRGESGRVEEVFVRGTEGSTVVRRDAIRSRLGGLRSNLFMVAPQLRPDGAVEHFYFEGAGWGHGVGMCQTGAAGMAADGWPSTRILEHYYPRAPLTTMY